MTVNESTQLTTEKSKSFKSLVTILMVLGIFGVLAGAINLLGALSSGFSSVRLADVIFNVVYGVLLFICSRILSKGKVWAIWLFSTIILFTIVYSFIMGRGFNFIIAAFGAVVIWHLFTLKKQGELS